MIKQTMIRLLALLAVSFAVGSIAPTIAQTAKNAAAADTAKDDSYAHIKAVQAAEKLAREYNNKGVWLYNKGDYIGAVVSYDEAIRLDPKDSAAHCGRGSSRWKLGNKKGALEDYDKAIELDANFALYFFYRGELKIEMGDKEGAKHDLEEALRVDPSHKGAQEKLKWLTGKEDAAKAESK